MNYRSYVAITKEHATIVVRKYEYCYILYKLAFIYHWKHKLLYNNSSGVIVTIYRCLQTIKIHNGGYYCAYESFKYLFITSV